MSNEDIIKQSVEDISKRDLEYKKFIAQKISWISWRQKFSIILQILILITLTFIYYHMQDNNDVAASIIDAFKQFNK